MTSSPAELQAMRALAEKATGGEWGVDPKRRLRVVAPDDQTVANTGTSDHIRDCWEANAAFIAAANPQAVLGLLNALESARRLLSAWRYAKAFAGAEAWDAGHDMRQRFDLVDSTTELAGIEAAETFDQFRAHLGGQPADPGVTHDADPA